MLIPGECEKDALGGLSDGIGWISQSPGSSRDEFQVLRFSWLLCFYGDYMVSCVFVGCLLGIVLKIIGIVLAFLC